MHAPEPITLPPPGLEHVADLAVTIAAPIEVGAGALGMRRVIPITGGVVRGPRLNGRVLAGGADFQLIVQGTTAHLDARYVIELDDGSRVFVHNTALRHASADDSAKLMRGEPVPPQAVYFRCQPRFETAAADWTWLQHSQFVGAGVRRPDAVLISVYRMA